MVRTATYHIFEIIDESRSYIIFFGYLPVGSYHSLAPFKIKLQIIHKARLSFFVNFFKVGPFHNWVNLIKNLKVTRTYTLNFEIFLLVL